MPLTKHFIYLWPLLSHFGYAHHDNLHTVKEEEVDLKRMMNISDKEKVWKI
jgi:hypothetical protein